MRTALCFVALIVGLMSIGLNFWLGAAVLYGAWRIGSSAGAADEETFVAWLMVLAGCGAVAVVVVDLYYRWLT